MEPGQGERGKSFVSTRAEASQLSDSKVSRCNRLEASIALVRHDTSPLGRLINAA